MANYLILGATGGVGSEVARRLAARGHRLVLAGRSLEKLQSLSTELDQPQAVVDAGDLSTIDRAFDVCDAELAELNGVVNCIGSVLLKPGHLTTDAELYEVLRVNLMTAFAAIRNAVPRMRKSGGSIVLFSTAAARLGMPNHEAIAAAKAGVEGLARSAAASYASRGIRVNVVAPGLVKTEMSRSIWSNDDMAAASCAMHALGRLGEPGDIASCVEWLLSVDNTWTTGQVIGVDGGLSTLAVRRKA